MAFAIHFRWPFLLLTRPPNGKVLWKWGHKGKRPGEFTLPHMLAADTMGNLYIAEVGGRRLQKLIRKP